MQAVKILFLTLLVLAINSDARADSFYLFNAMKQKGYQKAWENMVQHETLPSWLEQVKKTKGNYVASPMKTIVSGSDVFECFYICKPHDCASEHLNVLFARSPVQAWGMLTEENKDPRWLGMPDERTMIALQECGQN